MVPPPPPTAFLGDFLNFISRTFFRSFHFCCDFFQFPTYLQLLLFQGCNISLRILIKRRLKVSFLLVYFLRAPLLHVWVLPFVSRTRLFIRKKRCSNTAGKLRIWRRGEFHRQDGWVFCGGFHSPQRNLTIVLADINTVLTSRKVVEKNLRL